MLNVQDLGPLEATTLTADDPAALDGWLTEHDYRMSEEFKQLVGPYVDVDLADVQSDLLRESLAQAPYLTTIDQTFSDPAESITSDFTFGTAADDQPYQQVYYTDTYLVPVDVAILVGLAVLGLTGAGLRVLRCRPR